MSVAAFISERTKTWSSIMTCNACNMQIRSLLCSKGLDFFCFTWQVSCLCCLFCRWRTFDWLFTGSPDPLNTSVCGKYECVCVYIITTERGTSVAALVRSVLVGTGCMHRYYCRSESVSSCKMGGWSFSLSFFLDVPEKHLFNTTSMTTFEDDAKDRKRKTELFASSFVILFEVRGGLFSTRTTFKRSCPFSWPRRFSHVFTWWLTSHTNTYCHANCFSWLVNVRCIIEQRINLWPALYSQSGLLRE